MTRSTPAPLGFTPAEKSVASSRLTRAVAATLALAALSLCLSVVMVIASIGTTFATCLPG